MMITNGKAGHRLRVAPGSEMAQRPIDGEQARQLQRGPERQTLAQSRMKVDNASGEKKKEQAHA